MLDDEEYERQYKIKGWKKAKSKCMKGRIRHRFRSPQTRSLTPDLRCWWCGKSLAQVREEQKEFDRQRRQKK